MDAALSVARDNLRSLGELLAPVAEQYDALASDRLGRTLLLVGHCITCVRCLPEAKGNFLLHYIMTFLLAFGGAMWSALLIMDPSAAPLSWVVSDDVPLYFTITWWLVIYSPLSKPINALLDLWPIKALPPACVIFNKSRNIVSRVELMNKLQPGVLFSPVVIATITGCGGMCTFDALRSAYGLNPHRPAEVTVAGKSFRLAFLVACMYMGNALLPQPLLLRAEMQALLTTICVAHSLASSLTGLKLDWTEAVMRPLLFIARIPWPTGAPQPLPPPSTREPQPKKKVAEQPQQAPQQQAKKPAAAPSQQHQQAKKPAAQSAQQQQQQQAKKPPSSAGAPLSHPIALDAPAVHAAAPHADADADPHADAALGSQGWVQGPSGRRKWPAVSHFVVGDFTGAAEQQAPSHAPSSAAGGQQQQQQQSSKARKRWNTPAQAAEVHDGGGAKPARAQEQQQEVIAAGLAAPNPFAALSMIDEEGRKKRT